MAENVKIDSIDLTEICDGNTLKLVTSLARFYGVPDEYIFYPLLTSVSAVLGKTTIKVNEAWEEKCTLWTAVGSEKGTRKTAIISHFTNTLNTVLKSSYTVDRQVKTTAPADKTNDNTDTNSSLERDRQNLKNASSNQVNRIVYDYMDSKQFLDFYKSNPPFAVSLFEDGKAAFDMIEVETKPLNRIYLERLYDAGFHPDSTSCPVYNIFCFIKGSAENIPQGKADEIFSKSLNDRFLYSFPTNYQFRSKDLKVPMADNTPNLKQVLEILFNRHILSEVSLTYSISRSALKYILTACDEFQENRQSETNEIVKAMWGKCAGRLVRLGCIFKAMNQALKEVVYEEKVDWQFEITIQELKPAKALLLHSIEAVKSRLETREAVSHQVNENKNVELFNEIRPKRGRPARNTVSELLLKRTQVKQELQDKFNVDSPAQLSKRRRQDCHTEVDETENWQITNVRTENEELDDPMEALCINANLNNHDIDVKQPTDDQQTSPTNIPDVSRSIDQPVFPGQEPMISTAMQLTTQPNTYEVAEFQSPEEMAQRMFNINIPDVVQAIDQPVFPGQEAITQETRQQLQLQVPVNQLALSSMGRPQSSSAQHPMTREEGLVFAQQYAHKLKKLLQFNLDHRVTPSVAAQRHLMPPLSKCEMELYNTPTKYPAALGKEFLKQVSRLGFGKMETVMHPTNKKFSMFLEKFPYESLGPFQKELVLKLGLTQAQYDEAFSKNQVPVYTPVVSSKPVHRNMNRTH